MAAGKSDRCIVPSKPGNSGGGKAATPTRGTNRAFAGHSAGRTSAPGSASSARTVRGVGEEPDALTAHVRF
jgi:hypothetical protein